MFEYEKSIADKLAAANIDNLNVAVTADISEEKMRTLMKPTAIVALGEESEVQTKPQAVLTEVTMFVYLVIRGAVPTRTNADKFYRDAIFQALHGELIEGMTTELAWRSTVSDYEDNARTYLMTFVGNYVKRKERPFQP
jgi:hypothetical protein